MTREEMDELTGGTDNKSEKIRLLYRADVSAADISRYLDIRYQHTYNVLLRAGLIVKPDARQAALADAGETIILPLGSNGDVRLPADMLAAHGLRAGDRLICRSGPDGLMIMSRASAIEHLREVARSRMPEEASLIEALLAGGDKTDEGSDRSP